MLPCAVSPVPTSSAPSAAISGRHPEWRPDEIGSPLSRVRTRSADRSSADSLHVTRRMSFGSPFSWCVWQVVNSRDVAKSGCTTIPIRPPSPCAYRSSRSARTVLRRAPSRTPDTSEIRPGRSVTSTFPFGRNPMSQPCSSPPVTTSTARPGTAVVRGAGLGVGSPLSDAVPPDAVPVADAVAGTSPTESSPEQAPRLAAASRASAATGAVNRDLMPQSHPGRSAVARS